MSLLLGLSVGPSSVRPVENRRQVVQFALFNGLHAQPVGAFKVHTAMDNRLSTAHVERCSRFALVPRTKLMKRDSERCPRNSSYSKP